jgi:hypothetical protein
VEVGAVTASMARLLALLFVLAPAAAWACPQCASREGAGLGVVLLLGAMILLPFGVFFIVLRIIRRGESREDSLLHDAPRSQIR